MKKLIFLLCLIPSAALGQPTSSPALDKDYVVLKVLEQHKGYYASEAVGGVIKSMGIMRPQDEYSVVFLNNVDTSDPVTRGDAQAFGAGPFFSLRNKPEFSIRDAHRYVPLAFRSDAPKDLYFSPFLLLATDYGIYENPAHILHLWAGNPYDSDTTGFGEGTSIIRIPNPFRHSDDFLLIGDLGHKNGVQRKTVGYFPSRDSIVPDSLASAPYYKYIVADWDSKAEFLATQNLTTSVTTDSSSTIVCYANSDTAIVLFGEFNANYDWVIRSVHHFGFGSKLLSLLSFDFLYSDGIPDLIIGSADTIYCYDGRDLPSILKRGKMPEAALKIPSPAKLDPLNFEGGINNQGKPLGELDWGEYLFDAGNLNGSGAHSLGVEALYYWRSSSLGHLAYFFLYSGGPAADEKVDAIFEDHTNPIYCGFTTFDTVQQGPGKPCNALVGDFGFNAGGSGSIWYLEGSKTIPHKPDPRWISGVQAADLSQAALILTPEGENIHISIGSPATSARVRIFNLLGQQISDQDFYGTDMQFRSPLGSGTYICEVQTATQVFRKSFTVLH